MLRWARFLSYLTHPGESDVYLVGQKRELPWIAGLYLTFLIKYSKSQISLILPAWASALSRCVFRLNDLNPIFQFSSKRMGRSVVVVMSASALLLFTAWKQILAEIGDHNPLGVTDVTFADLPHINTNEWGVKCLNLIPLTCCHPNSSRRRGKKCRK